VALAVELADELVDGAKGAALPLIRHDLGLSYGQIGLLASVPLLVGGALELPLGLFAGAGRRRRRAVLGGGIVFILSLLAVAGARSFIVLLVAFGAPRQDKWIHSHLGETGVKVAMGVGGLFDFYSGRIPRAPLWLREAGGEWLYRFYQEPRRMWRRYFVGNVVFLWHVVRSRKQVSRARGGSKP